MSKLFSTPNHTKYLCLNIAKTAGTSLSNLLADNFNHEEVITEYGKSAIYDHLGHLQPDYFLKFLSQFKNRYRVKKAKAFIGHLPFLDKALYNFPAEYIVFLRNPIAKLISGYSYGIQNIKMPQDFFEYDLHLACSAEQSHNFSNPILQVLLRKSIIDNNDIAKLDELIQSIDFIGITEAFDYSCQRLLHHLGKPVSNKNYCLNTGNKIATLPASTIQTIKFRNHYDILLYNKACDRMNAERATLGLDAIPLCEVTSATPFSSGDYHPALSCFSAFDGQDNAAWLSSALYLSLKNEYIGYDFGINQQRVVDEIKLQLLGQSLCIVSFALEASNDSFINDIKTLMTFEVAVDNKIHIIQTGVVYFARMWRIRRISELKNSPLIVSTLSFAPEQETRCKDTDAILTKINHITTKYTGAAYMKILNKLKEETLTV